MKVSPCSGRTDWVSVAKENPTTGGGGPFFEQFPGSHSWSTFAEAMAEATTLRGSSLFSTYCCREYSVWQNNQSGKFSVVLGKFGNAGFGWRFVKGDLCCDEAFAEAGLAPSCEGGGGSGCFANDQGMASTNRDDHFNWAQQQDAAHLQANLQSKINLLFNCSAVTDDQLSSAFADDSVIIAKYVQDSACFGGDSGVIDTDWSSQKAWARTKSRSELLSNLQWKMAAAFKCLNRTGQLNLFADSSVTTAKAPRAGSGTGSGTGGGTTGSGGRGASPGGTSGSSANWSGTWKNVNGTSTLTVSGNGTALTASEIWNNGERHGQVTWKNCKVQGNNATCDWDGTYEGDPGKSGTRHGTLSVTVNGNALTGSYYEDTPNFVNADGTPFTGSSAMHKGAVWPIDFKRN